MRGAPSGGSHPRLALKKKHEKKLPPTCTSGKPDLDFSAAGEGDRDDRNAKRDGTFTVLDKGKPVVRRGRKAMGS